MIPFVRELVCSDSWLCFKLLLCFCVRVGFYLLCLCCCARPRACVVCVLGLFVVLFLSRARVSVAVFHGLRFACELLS